MSFLPAALLVALAACGSDVSVIEKEDPRCDGVQQPGEMEVDLPFDRDEDGYYDANNPGCAETYAADRLDCDDGDETVNPGAAEVGCNGIDDDCSPASADENDADADGITSCTDCDDGNPAVRPDALELPCTGIDEDCDEATPDAPDLDGDGATACGDCDDSDARRAPDREEECGDGVDNDCDDIADEDCAVDWSGAWAVSPGVAYSCAFGLVTMNFNQLVVSAADPVISFAALGSAQPGTMSGLLADGVSFDVSNTLAGTCTESYRLVGSFTSASSFEGTFTATFTGGSLCFDCTAQTFTLTGTR
jgi:hypothetical protein